MEMDLEEAWGKVKIIQDSIQDFVAKTFLGYSYDHSKGIGQKRSFLRLKLAI